MSKDEYLITDAPLKALTVFAMPMILGSFFQQIYNMADSIIVGQFVGSSALAAVGACAALTNVFICVALGDVYKRQLFSIGGLELSIFIPLGIVLLVVSYIVMYKTRFGLRLRACGEHPQAADSVGINVYRMRYAGVLISGFLGGVGGLAYVIPSVQTWNFEVGVAGTGFLALRCV